jgi:pilus assembly protein CpaB
MSARQLIVLVIAGIAAVAALLLIRGMGARNEAPQEEAEQISGEQILVAARDVPQGAALTPSDLAVALFPDRSVGASFVRLSQQPSAQADFVGGVTRRAFAQGEPITMGAVVQPEGRGFLAAQLAPGYRAVAVEIDRNT